MRNHVIPKSIIRRFADHSGRIWFYRKPKQGEVLDIRHVGWKGIFMCRDIYDDETERRLQTLDGNANRIIKRIKEDGPNNVTLSASDMLTLCEFLGIQLLRSEKSIHETTCDRYIDGYVRETYRVPRPSREEFHEEVMRFIRRMISGGIRSWVDPERPESGQLTFRDIQIIGIPDTLNASFVVADSVPILYSKVPSGLDSPYSNELVNPDRIKILPVTPKLAIALCRENAFEDAPADKLVEAVNTTMFNECLAVAAYEQGTIQSLLGSPHTIKTQEKTLGHPPVRFHLNG